MRLVDVLLGDSENIYDIRVGNISSDVALHFRSTGHSIDDASVMCITTIPEIHKRRMVESRFIRRLGTLHPLGLNREDDSNYKTH